MYDLVIIGGGAASQAAAMYALGKRLNFLLICEQLGGRVEATPPIEQAYQLGDILLHFTHPAAEGAEGRLIGSSAVRLFSERLSQVPERWCKDRVTAVTPIDGTYLLTTAGGAQLRAATVIVATGAIPHTLNGIAGGHLIELLGHHTTNNFAALTDQAVAVLGDTAQALFSAAELSAVARTVYLILTDDTAAEQADVARLASRRNIELLPGFQLIAVRGSLQVERIVVGRGPEVLELTVSVAFADLGSEPASALIRHLVRTNRAGFVQVDRGCATSAPGLFAAGDVTQDEGEQVLTALGEGARAARSAHFYLLTRPLQRAVGRDR